MSDGHTDMMRHIKYRKSLLHKYPDKNGRVFLHSINYYVIWHPDGYYWEQTFGTDDWAITHVLEILEAGTQYEWEEDLNLRREIWKEQYEKNGWHIDKVNIYIQLKK